jgi:hypothetical protein
MFSNVTSGVRDMKTERAITIEGLAVLCLGAASAGMIFYLVVMLLEKLRPLKDAFGNLSGVIG